MKVKKINGLTRELHPFQIISYIFFSSVLITYFFIIFCLSSDAAKIVGCILEVISGLGVLISGYIATVTDPSDPYLKESRKAHALNQTYEPSKREFYCSTDHTYVSASSKHCRRCNRCTEEFDHHCKWINNDIGKANYKAFFVMISSVMVFLTVYLVFAIIVTVNYANDHLLISNNVFLYGDNRKGILAGLIIMWIFMGLSCAFLVLDVNLVLFHIFLRYKGLTTFQYITAVEERKEFKKELDYAMKILGKDKKTCLDFILCLKKRKKGDPAFNKSATIQAQTAPGDYELELAKSDAPKSDERKRNIDLESQKTQIRVDSKPTLDQFNEGTPTAKGKRLNQSIVTASPDTILSHNQAKNSKDDALLNKENVNAYNTPTGGYKEGESPITVQIEGTDKKHAKRSSRQEESDPESRKVIREISTEFPAGSNKQTPKFKVDKTEKVSSVKSSKRKLAPGQEYLDNQPDDFGAVRHDSLYHNHEAGPSKLGAIIDGTPVNVTSMKKSNEPYEIKVGHHTGSQMNTHREEKSGKKSPEEKVPSKNDIAVESYRDTTIKAQS